MHMISKLKSVPMNDGSLLLIVFVRAHHYLKYLHDYAELFFGVRRKAPLPIQESEAAPPLQDMENMNIASYITQQEEAKYLNQFHTQLSEEQLAGTEEMQNSLIGALEALVEKWIQENSVPASEIPNAIDKVLSSLTVSGDAQNGVSLSSFPSTWLRQYHSNYSQIGQNSTNLEEQNGREMQLELHNQALFALSEKQLLDQLHYKVQQLEQQKQQQEEDEGGGGEEEQVSEAMATSRTNIDISSFSAASSDPQVVPSLIQLATVKLFLLKNGNYLWSVK